MSETLIAEVAQNQEATAETNEVNADSTSVETDSSSEETAEQQEVDKVDDVSEPEGAPESYEFKMQEGEELSDSITNSFSEVAKELNLTQENAQKILDKMAPQIAQQQSQQVEALKSEWIETSKNDKEFGGEKLSENLAIAKKALDSFGSPELTTMLNESGLGNHPELIRMMYKAGKAISEDTFVGNRQGTGNAKDRPKDFNGYANALYGDK